MMNDELECICDLCKCGYGRMAVIGGEVLWVCTLCKTHVQRVWRMKLKGARA